MGEVARTSSKEVVCWLTFNNPLPEGNIPDVGHLPILRGVNIPPMANFKLPR